MADDELIALSTWFLLAWLDPLFLDLPEARATLAQAASLGAADRERALALHDRLLSEVIPAYRALADQGRIELSTSPYYHPILPLLIDLQSARRARPDMPLPSEPLAVPEDARHQIERALERHSRAFGKAPVGMWPSEGSVSPEAVELGARAGIRWMASDEGVLWGSLNPDARKREALYRPWIFPTAGGDVALFFRDHELSDRIGFVYQHWDARQAVDDFLARLRRIGREIPGPGRPVVSVILDGENCWEHYPDDGGPFLDALYAALAAAPDIRTRTPSDFVADTSGLPRLDRLHSGSWINADFHIWIGHPEKNRAWELLARSRRALVEASHGDRQPPEAWDALAAAEGSDWFWWFGDDHYTQDKAIFDGLFRHHLRAVHDRAGLAVPGWLDVPISGLGARRDAENVPVRFIRPTIDGHRTGFYEWTAAGRIALGAGGTSMHRAAGLCRELYFGFDQQSLFLRVDFTSEPPGVEYDLTFELMSPRPGHWTIQGLAPGRPPVVWSKGDPSGTEVRGATCHIGAILEVELPFASLGLTTGEAVELLGHLVRDGQPVETIPSDRLIRFTVPDETFEDAMWSA
jgi:alpha-amylase/alpha-mannosidase (GH57 family)